MSPADQPHDGYFKAVFRVPENIAGELRALLPAEVLAAIDLGHAELVDTNMIDDALRQRFADRLVQVRLADAGREAYVLVVFEHQSTIDPHMPLRVLFDIADFLKTWLDDNPGATHIPAVIPIVVHQGAGDWTGPRTLAELIDLPPAALAALGTHLPSLELLIDDLAPTPSADLAARSLGPSGRIALVLLRAARARGGFSLDALEDVAHLIAELSPQAFAHMTRYVGSATDVDPEAFQAFVDRHRPGASEESTMPTMFEQLMDRGRDQGRVEGRVEEARALLLRLLRIRFPAMTPDDEARVQGADLATVERWAERFVTATSLAEVFAG